MDTPDNQEMKPEFQPDALEARNGASDIFGKLDDEIPPIRINGDALDQMRRNARAAGCNLSEYLRNKLYIAEFGFDHINSLREAQLRRVMGIASQTPSEGGDK